MAGHGEGRDARSGSDPVVELEAFIAQSEARGEPVPPEAHLMLARLRELMTALRGLSQSLDERGAVDPKPDDGKDSGAG